MDKVILVLYFCFSLFVFADATVGTSDNVRVQTLVKQVKSAQPSEKRVLMNRLKVMLRQSNKTHRLQVMKELKQSFSHGNAMHQGSKKREHKKTSARCAKHQLKHKRWRNGKGKGKGKGGKYNGESVR
jgi:hypothetical protein